MKFDLFENRREIAIFAIIAFVIFAINVGFKFLKFRQFQAQNSVQIHAKIQNFYYKSNKNGKKYLVLKLKTDDFTIYTTSFDAKFNAKIDTITPNERANFAINTKISTKNLNFYNFLSQNFYAPSFNRELVLIPTSNLAKFQNFIHAQHAPNLPLNDLPTQNTALTSHTKNSDKIAEFYLALFLATPISAELRADITHWGIAHLVAISGFHIGIIFGTLFFVLRWVYRYFQARFFPWRSAKFDISVVIFALLFGYLFVLDFAPSYLRSLAMGVFGFILLVRNLRITSFGNLFIIVAFLIALFPSLLFSIGFYFSCLGVFYIFAYCAHFWGKFGTFIDTILLNLFVFLAMNLPVYFFFETISAGQLAVIPISFAFVVFYPISVILHAFGAGGLLDEYLIAFLDFKLPLYQTHVPFWLFLASNLLSLGAIWRKEFIFIIAILGFTPLFFIEI